MLETNPYLAKIMYLGQLHLYNLDKNTDLDEAFLVSNAKIKQNSTLP